MLAALVRFTTTFYKRNRHRRSARLGKRGKFILNPGFSLVPKLRFGTHFPKLRFGDKKQSFSKFVPKQSLGTRWRASLETRWKPEKSGKTEGHDSPFPLFSPVPCILRHRSSSAFLL
jgi:hypothetical protein